MSEHGAIKAWARRAKCKVRDLIALAPQNDPFYSGTPRDVESAEWFAALWKRFNYAAGIHIRRVHYQILSQDPPVAMPSGRPYENTERCWRFLNLASKAARYLELVDAGAFVDRRNPEPTLFVQPDPHPHLAVRSHGDVHGFALPELPALPTYELEHYEGSQRYLVEIWCEKSTMNDVLVPLCQDYGINLVTGVGELSITSVLHLVRDRVVQIGKPARILYVSDFDPAGMSMPVAVSRKIEYFVRNSDVESGIKLRPAVLTEDQVRHYRLPRTPIKESERRKAHFEDHHGSGATELDALEALHPGALREILEQEVRRYIDVNLAARAKEAYDRFREQLDVIEASMREEFGAELRRLEEEYGALREGFAGRIASWQEQAIALHTKFRERLEAAKPDLERFPVPQARPADEPEWSLYDSALDYEAQLSHYKAFQNGADAKDGSRPAP